jgi:hypothetical protein
MIRRPRVDDFGFFPVASQLHECGLRRGRAWPTAPTGAAISFDRSGEATRVVMNRGTSILSARLVPVACVLALCVAVPWAAWAQSPDGDDRQQMRGLDEQIQEIKSDVLAISAELNQLEEKLLFPSGTQVAVFVALDETATLRLDAVQLRVDGELVAHAIYSAKELEALRRGGVQRLYVGNVATGSHRVEVQVDGMLRDGAPFTHVQDGTFVKDVQPAMVGVTVSGPGAEPVAIRTW